MQFHNIILFSLLSASEDYCCLFIHMMVQIVGVIILRSEIKIYSGHLSAHSSNKKKIDLLSRVINETLIYNITNANKV